MTAHKVNSNGDLGEAVSKSISRRTPSRITESRAEKVTPRAHRSEAEKPVKAAAAYTRRTVSRTPDMSKPRSRVKAPAVSLMPIEKKTEIAKAKDESVPELTVQTVRDKHTNPFPLSIVLTTLFCTLLFMYMVYNYVEINEYSIKVSTLKSEITDLSEQQEALELQLAKRDDLTVIAEKAEELGMVKLDEVDKIYINGSGSEKIEVSDSAKRPDQGGKDILSDIMSAFGQNFRQLAEYLR